MSWADWENSFNGLCQGQYSGIQVRLYHKSGIRLCDNSPGTDIVKVAEECKTEEGVSRLYGGMELGGKKYTVVNTEDEKVVGLMKGGSGKDDAAALLIKNHNDYIVYCQTAEKTLAGNMATVAENACDLLKKAGL